MSIKLIVSDLDSTLLKRDKTISDYTADVFRRVRQRGIIVALATARPRRTAANLSEVFGADAMIVHNGAVVYDHGELAARFGIVPDTVRNVMEGVRRLCPRARLSVEIEDRLYVCFDEDIGWERMRVADDLSNLPYTAADKIIMSLYPDVLADADIREFERLIPSELYIQNCESSLALVMHRSATKMNAMRLLAERLNISLDEIAAFGDDYNDIDMLAGCGAGVAMSNAIGECKQAARHICGDCDEDGAAKWIEKHILA